MAHPGKGEPTANQEARVVWLVESGEPCRVYQDSGALKRLGEPSYLSTISTPASQSAAAMR